MQLAIIARESVVVAGGRNGRVGINRRGIYQQALNVAQFLDRKDTYETLTAEGEDGEKLRKQVMLGMLDGSGLILENPDYLHYSIKKEN